MASSKSCKHAYKVRSILKHKGYHLKKAILVKPSHLDHSFDTVTKFEQTKGHELGVKITREKKPQEEMTQPQNA